MKKEIILAAYININNIPPTEVDFVMEKITFELHKNKFNNIEVKWFTVPVKNQDTRIECVYPKYEIIDGQEVVKELKELKELVLV
jgi:hypothetical protein